MEEFDKIEYEYKKECELVHKKFNDAKTDFVKKITGKCFTWWGCGSPTYYKVISGDYSSVKCICIDAVECDISYQNITFQNAIDYFKEISDDDFLNISRDVVNRGLHISLERIKKMTIIEPRLEEYYNKIMEVINI